MGLKKNGQSNSYNLRNPDNAIDHAPKAIENLVVSGPKSPENSKSRIKPRINKPTGLENGQSNQYNLRSRSRGDLLQNNHNIHITNNIRDPKKIEPEGSKDINRPKGLENKEDIGYLGMIEPIGSKGFGPVGSYELRIRDEKNQSLTLNR